LPSHAPLRQVSPADAGRQAQRQLQISGVQ
jgi:hypothetical protein